MNDFERRVYETQAQALEAHCEEEIDFVNSSEQIMEKTQNDIAALKEGIEALDASIEANNKKIAEINALKKECAKERVACLNVNNEWNAAHISFSHRISLILDRLQREVDAREGVQRPAQRGRTNAQSSQNSRYRSPAYGRSASQRRQNLAC